MPQSKRHPARRPEKRPARQSHRPPSSGGPTSSSARRAPVTAVSPARRALEIRSAGPLAVINRWPAWLVPTLLAVFLIAGLALPSAWAALFLVPVALFLLWLLALAWPVLSVRGRVVRAVVVAMTVVATVAKALGWL